MNDDGDPTDPLSEYEGYDWEALSGVPPADELFGVLSNATRRRVLWYLLDYPETTLGELADVLAGWAASERDVVGPEYREAALVALHHRHLPVLVAAGLVTYDVDSGAVRCGSLPYPVEVVIEFSYQYERAVGATGT